MHVIPTLKMSNNQHEHKVIENLIHPIDQEGDYSGEENWIADVEYDEYLDIEDYVFEEYESFDDMDNEYIEDEEDLTKEENE